MIGITHKQARRTINALADTLIEEQEREDLNAHLDTCEDCRAYATQMKNLESRLQHSFHHRWDPFQGPSEKLTQNIQSRARRIVTSNRIKHGLRIMAGLTALIVLGIAINLVIGQLKSHSTKNPTAGSTAPAVSSLGRLIAFVSEQDGNSELYVMRTDGSGVTNITNNPAVDDNPTWSPDGTKIAFDSDRNGNRDIFVMNPDGSGLTQLTNDPANDILGTSPNPQSFHVKAPNVWSPDSRQLLFSNDRTGQWMLSVINADGSGVTQLIQANDPPAQAALWSPSGKQVAYTSQTGNGWMQMVAVNMDGTNLRVIATGDPRKSNAAWNSVRMIAWSQDEQFFYYEFDIGDGSWRIAKTSSDGANTAQIIVSGYGIPEGIYMNGWLGNDSVLYYLTGSAGTSNNVTTWHKMDNGNTLHWDPFVICGISPNTTTDSYPVGSEAASNAGSQSVLEIQCSNKGYSVLYFLDIKTGVFNEIAQISTNWSDSDISWSTDDQIVLIQGKNHSGKTEFYLLNAGDLQTIPPVTPKLIWSGESSQVVLQPVPFNNVATENRLPVVPTVHPNAPSTPLWTGTSNGD